MILAAPKRKRGRPKGVKNKPKPVSVLSTGHSDGLQQELATIASALADRKTANALVKGKAKDRRLSDALRDVLNMNPSEAEARLAARDAPTMADLIALATVAEGAGGNMKAVEQIGDRTEGRPTVQTPQVADGMVDRLVRLLVIGVKVDDEQGKADALDGELVEAKVLASGETGDDIPIGAWEVR
jgi:hypothetical protein